MNDLVFILKVAAQVERGLRVYNVGVFVQMVLLRSWGLMLPSLFLHVDWY